MAWLKYSLSHANGLEGPYYVFLGTDPEDIALNQEDEEYIIRNYLADGVRNPKIEVVAYPPISVIQSKIREASAAVESAKQDLRAYSSELAHAVAQEQLERYEKATQQ